MNSVQAFFRNLLDIRDPVMSFAYPENEAGAASLDVLRHRAVDIWAECISSVRFRVSDQDPQTGALTANRTSTVSRRLNVRPNALQPLPAFLSHTAERYLRTGRAVIVALRDDRGGIADLVCAHTASRVPGNPGWWDVVLPEWWDESQQVRTVGPDDVAVIERAGGGSSWHFAEAGAMLAGGAVHGLQRYQAGMTRPANVLFTDQPLNSQQIEQVRDGYENKHGRTVVMSSGLKPLAPPVTPVNGESAKTVEIGSRLVALAFGVPEPLLGVQVPGSTNTAAELLSQFKSTTLAGWTRQLAAALAMLAGLPVDCVEADLSGLTTVDRLERVGLMAQGVQALILQPNEARAVLGLAPVDAGDKLYGQRQLTPAEQLGSDLSAPPTV